VKGDAELQGIESATCITSRFNFSHNTTNEILLPQVLAVQ